MKIYFYIIVITLATINIFAQDGSHEIIWDQREDFFEVDYFSYIYLLNNSDKLFFEKKYPNSQNTTFGFYDFTNRKLEYIKTPLKMNLDSFKGFSGNDSLLCFGEFSFTDVYDGFVKITFYIYDVEKRICTDTAIVTNHPVDDNSSNLSNTKIRFSEDCSEIHFFNDELKLLTKYNRKTKKSSRIWHSKAYEYYFYNDSYIRYAGDSARVYDMSGNQIIKFDAEDNGKNINIKYFDGENILYTCYVQGFRSNYHKSLKTGETHFISRGGTIIPFENNKEYCMIISYGTSTKSNIYYYKTQELEDNTKSYIHFKSIALKNLIAKNHYICYKKNAYYHNNCNSQNQNHQYGAFVFYNIDNESYRIAPSVALDEINNLSISKNEEMAINISKSGTPQLADVAVYNVFSGDIIYRKNVEYAHCLAPDNSNIVCAKKYKITLRNIITNYNTIYSTTRDSILKIRSQDNYLIISYNDSIEVLDYFDKSIVYSRSNNEAELLDLNISNDRIFAATALGEIFVYNLKNSEFEVKYQIPKFIKGSLLTISKTAKYYIYSNNIYSFDNHEIIFEVPKKDHFYYRKRFLGDDTFIYLQRGENSYIENAFTYNLKTGEMSSAEHFIPIHSLFVYSSKNKITVVQDCIQSTASLMAVRSTISSVPDAITNDKMLFISPNPAEEKITINLPAAYGNEANIRIIDLLGNVIFEDKLLDQSEIKIDIAGFPNGMYNVILRYGSNFKYGKFVKR